MSEQSATLTLDLFYKNWKEHEDLLKAALAPLTPEQLAIRPYDDARSIGETTMHIILSRIGWLMFTRHGKYELISPFAEWDEPDAIRPNADELVQGLDTTWQMLSEEIADWSDEDLAYTFQSKDYEGNVYNTPRRWVIWHIVEHDIHHGGEISLLLGMNGLKGINL